MTGSIMQLEAADLLFDDEPERARETIRRVSTALKDGLDGVRTSLKAVKPETSLLGERRIQSILAAFEATLCSGLKSVIYGTRRIDKK